MAWKIPKKELLDDKAKTISYPNQLLINGRFTDSVSGQTFESINPSTGELLTHVSSAQKEDVDLAVNCARDAFEKGKWAKMSGRERGKLLFKVGQLIRDNQEEFAIVETLDNGKPIRESKWAAPVVAEVFEYYAGWADKYHSEVVPLKSQHLNYTLHEPLGVIGAITPWNFPTTQASFKTVPAIAMGNSVILKPAEQAPLTALLIGKYCMEAGIPEGVWNVLPGIGEIAGASLASHIDVDGISFTGSTEVGREIYRSASKNIKKISLELGGKSPNIVFNDADMDSALAGVISGIFYNQGEVCNAGSRVLIQEGIYDEFIAKLVEKSINRVVGDPLDVSTEMGAIISQEQLDKNINYINKGHEEGAKLLCGGKRIDRKGYFLEPTIFTEVENSMSIAQEEIFGPILSVIKFKDYEEAIKIANESMYGLAAGVWTKDIKLAHNMAKRLKAGTVWVNIFSPFDIASPWTGWKQSGMGTEWGKNMLEFVTQVKSVWIGL